MIREDIIKLFRVPSGEAVRLQPADADAHYNYGISLAQQGKLQDAAREFRATVQLRPADVEARYNLGIAAASLGQTDEAIEQFREALRLKPQFPEARQELERLLKVK